MSHDTIPARLQEQGRVRAAQLAYFVKTNGTWQGTNWGTYAREVRDAARALITLGVESGGTVSILGFNRPEWSIVDMAAMSVGAAPAGIYTTCSPPEVAYVISHSGASVVLLENMAQWAKVEAELDNLPELKHVVMMKGVAAPNDDAGRIKGYSWEDFMALAEETPEETVSERIDALQPDQLATLIYTSGTTGPPKGVMLSHQNLAWTAQIAGVLVEIDDRDSSLSYLPLSHIAEQIFTLHGPATYGFQIYYAESLDVVADNLKEVHPTILFAVPRIWEKFYAGIRAKLGDAPPVKAALASWATGVGRQVVDLQNRGESVPGLIQLQHRLADKLVLSKVRAALGLDRLRFAVSGAAPISKEILEFLGGFGVAIREVYGQSEDTGPTSFNRPGRTLFGTVGPAVPGVDVSIAADDEILVKGPNVFLGYFKDEKATAEALTDGWLHSGDLGRIDEGGFLHITGRKKDIIITAGGKNIAPKNIEASLKNDDLITEAVVIGDRRKFLSALICLDPDAAQRHADKAGISDSSLHDAPAMIAAVQKVVDSTNTQFARVEHIRKFTVLPRPLSVEDGELTPTLKVKRKVVNERYAAIIDGMYPKD